MIKAANQNLLKDERVVEEIRKHLWIESEKAGRDIGWDQAAEDWLKRFSAEWMKYNYSVGARPSALSAVAQKIQSVRKKS